MNPSSSDELVRDCDTILEHGDDASTTFADITNEIRSTANHLLQLYKKRSQMHTLHAKFQAALRDARTMCHLDPQSPLGYLAVGHVYREQGKQLKAIDIYTIGINAASTDDPLYPSLIQQKDAATLQLEQCVDFITQLPFEVVSRYIVPIIMQHQPSSTYNQWPYLHVSMAWRERLLRSAPLHYELDQPLNMYMRAAAENQLEQFKDYVGTVTLCRFPGGSSNNENAQVFPWEAATSLTRLNLYVDIEDPPEEPSNVLPILMAVGDRLTHLELSIGYQHDMDSHTLPVHLEWILEHVPHLRMLSMTRFTANEWTLSNTYPNLVSLCIHDPPHTMTHAAVMHVLEHCPSLRALTLFRCEQSQSLRAIHEHCPLINYLRYAPSRGQYEDDYEDFDSINMDSSTTPGLSKLDLVVDYSMYELSDVVSLLQQHHTTLENISMTVGLDIATAYDGREDLDIPFSNLKSLSFNHCEQSSSMYHWIIHNAPNITTLDLAVSSFAIPSTTMFNPATYHHLTTFSMFVAKDAHVQFLDRLISHHIDLDHQSSLKHLSLFFSSVNTTSPASIQKIGDLTQLDALSIRVFDDSWINSKDAFNIMLDKLASRDHPFSSFSWEAHADMLTYVLYHLQSMNQIRDLKLGHGLNELNVLQVLNCKPTKSLTMEYMDDISQHTLDMLDERFKNITLNLTVVVN